MIEMGYPEVFVQIQELGIGKTESKNTVHFCGLAWGGHESGCMFVPRQCLTEDASRNNDIARLTMKALAQYGRDMADRTGVRSFGEGNTGLLATINDLVADFSAYGVYSERARYKSINNGKPDWAHTVVRETAFIDSNGAAIYPDIRTSKSVDSHNTLLARIQASILLEIAAHHSWWLDALRGREASLKQYMRPGMPRALWPHKLRALLPELYATRAIELTKNLIAYLEDSKARDIGSFLYGVEDFHTIWEHMLRSVLMNVEHGWNAQLPRPGYFRAETGQIEIQERGMQTDIVLRNDDHLTIVDAKYYDARSLSTAPGWPDIVKQLFYDIAVSSITTTETVSGCFIFPANDDGNGPFSGIYIMHRDQTVATKFPSISCHYLSVSKVMAAYTLGQKIEVDLH